MLQLKCKVGDQHLAAEGLSSARFDTPAGLIIISAPAAVIAAMGLVPGRMAELEVTVTPDDEDATKP